VSFESNEEIVCEAIKNSAAVIGCAPWLNNTKILEELEKVKHGTCIVIDKGTFYPKNHKLYSKIPALSFDIANIPSDFSFLNQVESKINTDAIRVFGKTEPEKGAIKSLLHYKFFVLCDVEMKNEKISGISPSAVIFGSFNFTKNATFCREVTTFIKNKEVANDFFNEWARVFWLSEPIKKFDNKEFNPEYMEATSAVEIIDQMREEEGIVTNFHLDSGRQDWEGNFFEKDSFHWSDN